MVEVVAIPAELVETAWPTIAPMFQKAIDEGSDEYDIDDLYCMIEENEVLPLAVLFEGRIVAAIGLKLDVYPIKRVLTILIAGGAQMDEWLTEVMAVIKRLAQEQQADSIRVAGRRGWVKALRDYGYKEIHTTVEMEL